MESEEYENGVGGIVPEFGAIFMSNIATQRECFKQKIFGLPSAHANFVKQVKAGMLLFLFEFEKRELFGVFRATSDGAMNIVPNAFSSSGKQFPAQVRFAPIWNCTPLSEIEFWDAIRDNYYSAKKFCFGLSKNQVFTLLRLFNSRRLNNKMSRRQTAKEITRQVGEDRRQVNSMDIVEREDDDRFLISDKAEENEHKVDSGVGPRIWTDKLDDYWTKKRKINNDDRFLMSDVTESELFSDGGPQQASGDDCLGDSFGKMGRADDYISLSAGDRVEDYHITNNNLGCAISTEYPRGSFYKGGRVNGDDRFLINESVEIECGMDNGYGPANLTKHHEKRFGKDRLLLNDNKFLMTKYSAGNEHILVNGIQPVISTEHLGNPLGKRPTEDSRFLMNSRLQNEQYVDDCLGPLFLTEHIDNSLGSVTRATADVKFLMSESVETNRHISSEHLGNPMDKFRRATDDETLLISNRVENEHNIDNGFGSGIATEFSRYTNFCEDRRVADDGRFGKSDMVENARYMGNRIEPAFSSDITAFRQSEQNLFMNSIKPNLESDSFLLHDQVRHSSAFPCPNGTSHDAMATRTVPYDPEVPDIGYQCSSPSAVSHNYNSAQDHSSLLGSEGNFLSSSNRKGLAHFLESKSVASCFDIASGNGNKISFPKTLNQHNHSGYQASNKFLNAEYIESGELKTSTCKGYKSSLYSDKYFAPLSFPNGRTIEKVSKGPLSNAFSSSKNPSFSFDNGYPEVTHGKYELEFPRRESNEAFSAKEIPPSDESWPCRSSLHYRSSPQARVFYHHEKPPVKLESELYQSSENKGSDTNNDRTSVFARLSVAPGVCIQEEDNDSDMVHDECDMNASLDEVMDLLLQAHNHWVKMKKYKPSVRPNDGDEHVGYKEKPKFQKQIDFEQPLVTAKKMEIDANRIIKENSDVVLEETRLVYFNRRSKLKNNLHNSKAKGLMGMASINAADDGLAGKPGKRRKLIRPDFGKKESDEGKIGDGTQNRRSPIHESSYRNDTAGYKDAVKSGESSDISSCNAGMVHVTLPTTSEDHYTTSEQTPERKLSGQ